MEINRRELKEHIGKIIWCTNYAFGEAWNSSPAVHLKPTECIIDDNEMLYKIGKRGQQLTGSVRLSLYPYIFTTLEEATTKYIELANKCISEKEGGIKHQQNQITHIKNNIKEVEA